VCSVASADKKEIHKKKSPTVQRNRSFGEKEKKEKEKELEQKKQLEQEKEKEKEKKKKKKRSTKVPSCISPFPCLNFLFICCEACSCSFHSVRSPWRTG